VEVLAAARSRYLLPDRFLLSVGTLEPGKNRETVVRALRQLAAQGIDLPLVVVGQQGWLQDRAAPLQMGDALRYLGYVPDDDLPALYTLAEAFVFPSWLEGFGLPPLEALACGTPVVSSDRPAMPEVLGGAVLYADPRRPAAWAEALECVTGDRTLRQSLVSRGLEQVKQYSWERAARETLAVFEAALADRVGSFDTERRAR
ncbi:MAG: glycosyltransferase family 4 protein, partial [Dehalococcoidia bacterium]